ncbi:MAG: hypothetical protein F6K40_00650 [Okeania sp. SIO3I5]|uniref:hypothetical protein n=1 Tax=Okeania sp. SIO3I5 TaxID=2607805 RepID=UPI0013BDF635|nr:hypothetical protein [Okeania sp. SIO3I5]NEQ34896.1 hypothetical protein [Okeania sp. SIO3I5]
MSNQRSLTKNSFTNWIFCITFPLVFGYVLTLLISLVYLWVLWFLFQESQSRIAMLLPFVYCVFAFPYSIWAYYKSGIAIPRSILVGWHSFVAKFSRKNPIVIILLVICIVTANKFYKPPEFGFSDLELVGEKVMQLETKLNQTVSEKIEPLKISLATQLTLSDETINSEKYQDFYKKPPFGKANQEKINRIDNIYWGFKEKVKSQEEYIDRAEANLEKTKGSIRSIGEDLDGLISELENICNSANNSQEVDDEKYLAKKNEHCNKLRDISLQLKESTNSNSNNFQKFSNDLIRIGENVSYSKRFLPSWNNWLAAQKNVVDSRVISREQVDNWIERANRELDFVYQTIENVDSVIQIIPQEESELRSNIEAIEKESENFERQISEYENMKNFTLTKEIVNDAKNNLFPINDLFDKISQVEENTKILVDNLRKESDEIDSRITPLNNLYFEGQNLLKARRFTQEALSKKPNLRRELENINNLRLNELPSWKEKIQNELDNYQSLQKSISQRLGETQSSIKNTQDRFKYFVKSGENQLFLSTIRWSAIYGVIVAVGITVGWYLYEKRKLRKLSLLDPRNLDNLLTQIKETEGFVAIRKEAIKKIYEHQNNLNVEQLSSVVKRLKETVKQMEKFKSDDDVKVNAELRKVAESLELRVMEKRSFK